MAANQNTHMRKRKTKNVLVHLSPEFERNLQDTLASPEGQAALDELGRVFVSAAVDRMIEETECAEKSSTDRL